MEGVKKGWNFPSVWGVEQKILQKFYNKIRLKDSKQSHTIGATNELW